MNNKTFDVVALGELLVDFTQNGLSEQGNTLFEANPGGAPANVLAMLRKLSKRCAFIGKVGRDSFGDMLATRRFPRRSRWCTPSRTATGISASTASPAQTSCCARMSWMRHI